MDGYALPYSLLSNIASNLCCHGDPLSGWLRTVIPWPVKNIHDISYPAGLLLRRCHSMLCPILETYITII